MTPVAQPARVKVLFASCAQDLVPSLVEEVRGIRPEIPLVVVSEFPPPHADWIPYQIRRDVQYNLQMCRARLAGRHVWLSAVVLQPTFPYWKMRLTGFLLKPTRLLVFNEHLGHFALRPGSLPAILKHVGWRISDFYRKQARPGGFVSRWLWRLSRPEELRRPIFYRVALAAGWTAGLLKRGSPKPAATPPMPPAKSGISVVIPSRSGRELLERCLPAVLEQLPPASSEIIVVDNGSDDGTSHWLRDAHPHILIESSTVPLSFARAVNQGVRRASYSHVCLLNNDMVIEAGFFTALRDAFHQVPDLFCATAQIFLPEGQRREETGKAAMPLIRPIRGFPIRCETPIDGEDATYVLYGSGGCSLYNAGRLRALGGLSEVFDPAYVEDLDLGFQGWRRGWPTVFVARARVLHHHRTTTTRYYSERELNLALERNFLKFLTRSVTDHRLYRELWRETIRRINIQVLDHEEYVETLASACRAPAWIEPMTKTALPEREIFAIGSGTLAVFPGRTQRGKPVVMVVSPYVPFPLSHGGAVRMFNLIRRAAADFDQILVCFVDELRPVPTELLELCVEVICVRRSGTHAIPHTPRPDVVEEFDSNVLHATLQLAMRKWKPAIAQLEFTQMAQYAPECAPAKTMLVEHDITLDLYSQLLAQREDWETRQQYEKWVRFENYWWGRVDRVVVMSEKDRGAVGRPNAVVLANGVDLLRFQPSTDPPELRRVLFIGSFAHLPNVLAMAFFLRKVWPELAAAGATLHVIAGSRYKYYLDRYRDRVELKLDQPGIEVEDFVLDVRPAYRRATVVVAPLLASAGTNIKIMEAMAMGKAIVSTLAGINGLDLNPGRDVAVVNTGEEMFRAILTLFDNPTSRASMERQARKTVEQHYDWDVIAREQAKIYQDLLKGP